MNKIVFVVAMMFAGSAMASSHNACVPLPPKRPANLGTPAPVFNTDPNMYGAIVKNGQVIVKAPLGSDVQVDVDGKDLDVSVEGKDKTGFNKILPWNWSIWK